MVERKVFMSELRDKKRDIILGAIGASMLVHSGLVVKEKIPTPPNIHPQLAGTIEALTGTLLIANAVVTISESKPTPPSKRRK